MGRKYNAHPEIYDKRAADMDREERNYRRPRRYRDESEDDFDMNDIHDDGYDSESDGAYRREYGRKTGYEKDLRSLRRRDGEIVEHRSSGSHSRRASGSRRDTDYYEDRSEYFRERDRYFAERDKYYQERDRYYNDMDEYSRIASSAADEAYEEEHRGRRYEEPDDEYYYNDEEGPSDRRRTDASDRAGSRPRRADRTGKHAVPDRTRPERYSDTAGKRNMSEDEASADYDEQRDRASRKKNSPDSADTGMQADRRNADRAQQNNNASYLKNTAADVHTDKAHGSKNGKKKKGILWVILVLLLAFAAFVGYKFIKRQSGYYTVAVFGVDSRNGNVGKGALSDVNIIARVDMETGEIKLVSIYRDTYTQIDKDGDYHKFNEAYFRGGPEQAVWALEHNTDIKVDDYVTFNWKAVVDAINILGGVDIDISDAEFKYINAYITETVNSTGVGSVQLQHAGMNHLDGVQAVAYARLRKMDDDYTRTERQRKVISLAMDKAKNADFSVLNNILVTVLPQTSTSVGISDLLPFAKNINKYYIGETAGFPFDKKGKNIGKLDAVIPVTWESNDIALHEFLYPGVPYTPSKLVKEISAHVAEKTGLGGSGETSVKTDDLVTGQGGTAVIQESTAESESQTEAIDESESESETIEEIVDDSGDETDNDSYNEEDIVPGGSNSNVEHNGSGADISDVPEESYDTISGGSGNDGPGGPGSGAAAGPEDRSDVRESVAATKIE